MFIQVGEMYRHRRGNLYIVMALGSYCIPEPSDGLKDVVVYYRDGHKSDGIWVRDLAEFGDGRFTLVEERDWDAARRGRVAPPYKEAGR